MNLGASGISGSFETYSDEELVLEFQGGNEKAFDFLVKRYQERAVRLAFSMIRNWETAKEISQNAFVKTYFGLKSFKRESKFGTWFYRIVSNQAHDEIRKLVRAKDDIRSDSVLETRMSPEASPDQVMVMEEERRRLESAVAALPENEQKVFSMRYFNEMPLQEIADVLGVALGTVKAHLFHATGKIKKALEKKEVSRHE